MAWLAHLSCSIQQEREENVKADVFHAYLSLLKQTRPAQSWLADPDAMEQGDTPLTMLQSQVNSSPPPQQLFFLSLAAVPRLTTRCHGYTLHFLEEPAGVLLHSHTPAACNQLTVTVHWQESVLTLSAAPCRCP